VLVQQEDGESRVYWFQSKESNEATDIFGYTGTSLHTATNLQTKGDLYIKIIP
jgi:hypothetical protein